MKKYDHITAPYSFKEFYSKYPQGYTIFEALLDWVNDVNEMVDVLNLTLVEWSNLKTWVGQELKSYSQAQLEEWLHDDTLADLIDDVLFNSKADKTALTALQNDYNGFKSSMNTFKSDMVTIVRPNNSSDNTSHIQTALNGAGNIKLIGSFKINDDNLQLKSNTSLDLTEATLNKIATASANYYMLNIKEVDNVHIQGGTIIGDLDNHLGQSGEWGHAINIINSTNITVRDTVIKNMWGDGVYIGHEYYGTSTKKTDNILLDNLLIDRASRNGVSLCGGRGLKITNTTIKNVTRLNPKASIDIEPEGQNPIPNFVNDIEISNVTSIGSDYGLIVNLNDSVNKDTNISVENMVIRDGLSGIFFPSSGTNTGLIKLTNTVIRNVRSRGVSFGNWKATGSTPIYFDGLTIDDFNTAQSSSSVWYAGIGCYEEGTPHNLGNITFKDLRVRRNTSLTGIAHAIYCHVNGGGKFSNIKIINPIELTGTSNGIENVYFSNVDKIEISDPHKAMRKVDGYFGQSISQWLWTYIDISGAVEDVYLDIGNMPDGFEFEVLNNSPYVMILRTGTGKKFVPQNWQNIKIWNVGGYFRIKRRGNNFFVLNSAGNVEQFI